ncbi:MAG: hypothetical protein WKF57_13245 [Nakamurella sp.]
MFGWIVLIVGTALTGGAALLAFVPQWFHNPLRHESEHYRPGNRQRILLVAVAVVLGFSTVMVHATVQKHAVCADAVKFAGLVGYPDTGTAEAAATAAGYILLIVDGEGAGGQDSDGSTRYELFAGGALVATWKELADASGVATYCGPQGTD